MKSSGMHHLGLATHDMEATLAFYEGVLGFQTRVCDLLKPQGGGVIRHAFLDIGEGEMIAFMECNEVPGIAADFDAGINRGLGIAGGVIHFAFAADDEADLLARQAELRQHDVEVTDVVDHGWCKSIYFKDPNNLQLEFCVVTKTLGEQDTADRSTSAWQTLSRTG